MLPKLRPVPKDELDPVIEEPKIEGDELKAGVVVPPKIEGDELGPNPAPVGAPNSELVEEVEPKGLDEEELNGELKIELDEEPNPDEPKGGVLSAKGLEDVEDEKGLTVA